MKRDKAIETIKELPQEFDLDELIERLIFVEKVEKGLRSWTKVRPYLMTKRKN